jgi:RHS repeat-associated protein
LLFSFFENALYKFLKSFNEHGKKKTKGETWNDKVEEWSDISENKHDKILYPVKDRMGSTRMLTDDINIDKVYDYDSFGTPVETNHVNDQGIRSNIYHYAGYIYDYATSQYYVNARYYLPEVGRFAAEDRLKVDGLNRYVYVRSNPLRFVDPSGYCSAEGEYIYADEIRKALINRGYTGPIEYTVYDLNEKVMDGVLSVAQDYGIGLATEIAKVLGKSTVLFEIGYGYYSTVSITAKVLDKQEKSRIIESVDGDKLELYSSRTIISVPGKNGGWQTSITYRDAYIISKEIDSQDVVVGIVAPGITVVSKTGPIDNGVEYTSYDFTREIFMYLDWDKKNGKK